MSTSTDTAVDHEILIVGAGFSGMGTAIELDRAGVRDYQILDAGDGLGGTWRCNTYPGVAVDFPVFSYQFSFEQRSDWSRVYAPGSEVQEYAEHCADKYGLRSRMRFDTKIDRIDFEGHTNRWRVTTAAGDTMTARFVVNATGSFPEPNIPKFNGIENFAGRVLHTARWDPAVDLTGKRVGIVGTGASGVQLASAVAAEVAQLTVFQRTPVWVVPKYDAPLSARLHWVLEHVPLLKPAIRALSQAYIETVVLLPAQYHKLFPLTKLAAVALRRELAAQVHDPAVRDKLTPRYALGCKPPAYSNAYLSTFNRENVYLETDPIDKVTTDGVHTAEGVEHELDVLILATGFKMPFTSGVPFQCVGSDGIDLHEYWSRERTQAYQGVSVPGFPNYFSVSGPYSYNGSSYFNLIEASAKHIARCLGHARRTGATRVEVTKQANTKYFEEMLRRRWRQVFWQDTCGLANAYYVDVNGDVPLRPTLSLETAWRSARFALSDYRFENTPASETVK
ncbi:flavin-containing monooxygenase [Nocardia sp. CA-136227]|uniref:flavin-containing monooxygenase n=1 Tax=Nocardia sp. CA-136227 TaxID=3239979 RepID=UPI003D97009F